MVLARMGRRVTSGGACLDVTGLLRKPGASTCVVSRLGAKRSGSGAGRELRAVPSGALWLVNRFAIAGQTDDPSPRRGGERLAFMHHRVVYLYSPTTMRQALGGPAERVKRPPQSTLSSPPTRGHPGRRQHELGPLTWDDCAFRPTSGRRSPPASVRCRRPVRGRKRCDG